MITGLSSTGHSALAPRAMGTDAPMLDIKTSQPRGVAPGESRSLTQLLEQVQLNGAGGQGILPLLENLKLRVLHLTRLLGGPLEQLLTFGTQRDALRLSPQMVSNSLEELLANLSTTGSQIGLARELPGWSIGSAFAAVGNSLQARTAMLVDSVFRMTPRPADAGSNANQNLQFSSSGASASRQGQQLTIARRSRYEAPKARPIPYDERPKQQAKRFRGKSMSGVVAKWLKTKLEQFNAMFAA